MSDKRASRVISLRLKHPAAERLSRLARRFNRSVGETAGLLLDEKLREEEFPFVEFRESSSGRQPYVSGHRLAVWQVVLLTRDLDGDPARTAEVYSIPENKVVSALAYASAYPEEIEKADEAGALTIEDVRRQLPWARVVEV